VPVNAATLKKAKPTGPLSSHPDEATITPNGKTLYFRRRRLLSRWLAVARDRVDADNGDGRVMALGDAPPRQRRRLTGQAYQKRPVSGALAPTASPAAEALTGSQAHQLAARIDTTQHRYQVSAIRRLGDRRCSVIVIDRNDRSEHTLQTIHAWERLRLRSN
jgi:hypothetical protein